VVADTLEIGLQRKIDIFTFDQCEKMLTDDSFVQQYLQRACKLNEDNDVERQFFEEAKESNNFNRKALNLLEKVSKTRYCSYLYENILGAWGLTELNVQQ
jgi:hypothetical protein